MTTVVGVCGGSGSGKTTLARRLVAALGPEAAASLSFDSYYHDHSHLSVEERATVNFDHPDSLDVDLLVDHLEALRHGRSVEVPVYDFATHTRSGELERIEPRSFVIIEGILLFSFDSIRSTLDVLIYRHCPEELRAARRFRRDVEKRGRTPESVRAQWDSTVRPMHAIHVEPYARYADVVVPHHRDLDEVVDDLAASLRRGELATGGV